LSGNHANVKLWERRESLRRTLITRPEMLQGLALSQEERDWLVEAEPKAARILWEGSK
jgi:tRNA (guanine37-N1)-methyltransferase